MIILGVFEAMSLRNRREFDRLESGINWFYKLIWNTSKIIRISFWLGRMNKVNKKWRELLWYWYALFLYMKLKEGSL